MSEPTSATMSDRARIAMLTLKLRAAEREEAALVDQLELAPDGPITELRSRLTPMLAQRTAAMELDLAEARRDADARIDAIRRDVEVARERRRAKLAALEASVTDVAEVDDAPASADSLSSESAAGDAEAPASRDGAAQGSGDDGVSPSSPGTSPDSSVPPTAHEEAGFTAAQVAAIAVAIERELDRRAQASKPTASPGEAGVVFDPTSFANLFAQAMAIAFAERRALDQQRDSMMPTYPGPWHVGQPNGSQWFYPPQPAPQKSFWASAWHADVLLSIIALVIVLVVLIAWST